RAGHGRATAHARLRPDRDDHETPGDLPHRGRAERGRARLDHADPRRRGALHRAGRRRDRREHRPLRAGTGRLPAPARMDAVKVETELDAAVRDFAERFRIALDPPELAGATVDHAALAARFDEALPERGMPLESLLADLEAKATAGIP